MDKIIKLAVTREIALTSDDMKLLQTPDLSQNQRLRQQKVFFKILSSEKLFSVSGNNKDSMQIITLIREELFLNYQDSMVKMLELVEKTYLNTSSNIIIDLFFFDMEKNLDEEKEKFLFAWCCGCLLQSKKDPDRTIKFAKNMIRYFSGKKDVRNLDTDHCVPLLTKCFIANREIIKSKINNLTRYIRLSP